MRQRATLVALGICYPAIVAAGCIAENEFLKIGGLAALLLVPLLPGLTQGKPLSWSLAVLGAVGLGAVANSQVVMLPLLVTPVIIPAAVAWLFARSLSGGCTPLVEQFVWLLHSPDEIVDPAILRYARRLTWAWAVLLSALSITNAALGALMWPGGFCDLIGVSPPVSVSRSVWAVFTNICSYLIIGAFFVAEYAYRRHRFPAQPYSDFTDFVRRSIAAAPRLSGLKASNAGPASHEPSEHRH